MASKGFVKALLTTTTMTYMATARSCYEGSCSSFGLDQEKYLLQAFSREKALTPRALIMAKVQAPRSYVRDRKFTVEPQENMV